MTETKVIFSKKVDNYQSEVLWRIQNAEEMIKRCVPEQRVKDLNEMHANAVSLVLDDHKKAFKEKLAENLEQNSFLI